MSRPHLTLVSHHLCPYVQRVAIVLAEKEVSFERVYIDLRSKPDWFRIVSPLGKVPLLKILADNGTEAVLFESAPICEYLEETIEHPALHARNALTRARHRAWIEFGSSLLADIWGLETATEESFFNIKRAAVAGKFARIEAELEAGPYFSGPVFSIVDAVFAPIFRYFDVFDKIANSGAFLGLPKTSAWRSVLAERQSVRLAVTDDYEERLMIFLRDKNAWLLSLSTA